MALEERLFKVVQPVLISGWSSSGGGGCKNLTWLPTIVMIFLTINSIIAVNRYINDVGAVMFILTVYADVVLLVCCLLSMEKTPEMKRSVKMKAAVWALASTLTVLLTYRIAIMLPLFLAVIVWIMACVIVFGGFYALLLGHRKEPADLCNKG